MQAQLWDHRDMSSLGAWLSRHQHVAVLELSTADQELGGMAEKEAAHRLSHCLPARCVTHGSCEGTAATAVHTHAAVDDALAAPRY